MFVDLLFYFIKSETLAFLFPSFLPTETYVLGHIGLQVHVYHFSFHRQKVHLEKDPSKKKPLLSS